MINPPSLRALLSAWFKGLIGAAVVSALLSLIIFHHSGAAFLSGSFAPTFEFLAGGWALVVLIQSLYEPTVIIEADRLVVRRWGAALFRLGGRTFPLQRLEPVEVTLKSGRGGRTRAVQMSLRDDTGRVHKLLFFFISLAKVERAMGQTW